MQELGVRADTHARTQPVCHICGGMYRALDSGWRVQWLPVQQDTLFMGFSVVKGVAATCLLSCVDKGEIDFLQVLLFAACRCECTRTDLPFLYVSTDVSFFMCEVNMRTWIQVAGRNSSKANPLIVSSQRTC